jgi:putative hemolysin
MEARTTFQCFQLTREQGSRRGTQVSAAAIVTELLIVAGLIVLNGLFALSELAVVSARHSRLKSMQTAGRRGAQQALDLASNPGRFLSAVQIGITLIGIINGAYSGEVFGVYVFDYLKGVGASDAVAKFLGYGTLIVAVTYLSVIIGELVPKNLALRNSEGIACAVAPFMTAFAKAAAPAVWLLDYSTRLVFRLFGQTTESESRVTDEEIRSLIAEAETSGVLEKASAS